MNNYAKVAGLNISFSGFDNYEDGFNCWRDFLTEAVPPYDLTFCHKNDKKDFKCPKDSFMLYPLMFHHYSDNTVVSLKSFVADEYADIKMVADKDWSRFDIYAPSEKIGEEEMRLLTDAAFRSRISQYSGFAAHASVIIYNGEAVIFSANKGVGKSTHAEIWREHLKAEILNGDHALIRIIDDKVYVFGAPWSGTSPYRINSYAPLKAIILLEQAKHNEISPLNGSNAYLEFVSHCHLPTWDDVLMNAALLNIEKVVYRTNVYKLRCNTDPEAAIIVRNTVY